MARSSDPQADALRNADAPYPGLAAYQESDEDAELFFGRAIERDLIIANLRSARVTVLYGASGVGKSSLLRAGVVHRLRTIDATGEREGDEDEPRSPVIIFDEWVGDAAAGLIRAIDAAVGTGPGTPEPHGPVDELLRRLHGFGSGAVLVILDQFEEYLRLHPEPTRLDDLLSALVTEPEVLVRVLIAVRDDRLAELDRFEGRIPTLLSNCLRLEPLTRDAAREAIVQPVDRYNQRVRERGVGHEVELETGLADEVLDQLGRLDGARDRPVNDGSGSRGPALADAAAEVEPSSGGAGIAYIEPAVLQLTMRRLWDADIGSGGTTIRRATLSALGGASRIFATHLDVSMGALPKAEQRLAAELLRFLVTPSGAIRSYSAADLSAYVGRDGPQIEALAEKLSRQPARILRASAGPGERSNVEYELAHQVLARPALDWRSRFETARLERRAQRLGMGLVAVSALALALVGYALQTGPLRRLELGTVDTRFAIRGAQPADRRIVMVTVDDRGYSQLTAPGATPRAIIARALSMIRTAAPRVIACDIIFTGARSPSGDTALIRAIHASGPPVVLATDVLDATGQTELLGRNGQLFTDHGPAVPPGQPARLTSPAAGWAGFPGKPNDPGTVIRTMQRSVILPSGGIIPMNTLAVVTAREAGLSSAAIRALPATTWIAFRGGAGTFPHVPLDAVLAGQPSALSQLRNKIVVLGITATAAHDLHKTPAPGAGLMPGPEIQANAISTALRRFPLRDAGRGADVALIIVLGLIPLALALRLSILGCALGALAAAALFCVAAELAFDSGRVVNVVFPLLSLALSTAGVLAVLLARRAATARHRAGQPTATGGR